MKKTESEIKFVEEEIDRLRIAIMPLSLQKEGYELLLNSLMVEKGQSDLWESCKVITGDKVLIPCDGGHGEALFEVTGVMYLAHKKAVRVRGVRLLNSGNRPKHFADDDLGSIQWFAKNHKLPCKQEAAK